ncbi:ATP-binding protein [Elusimicrobiota bacterium]
MKQIAVISGKGGTGKTVITGALCALAKNHVMVDCDVDAADLHLLLQPKIKEKHLFKSGKSALIDSTKCSECGKCIEICRFDAVNKDFIVDDISCEGCSFCSYICPEKAIEMKEKTCGEWYISDTRYGKMVHAALGIAEENSGKLVTLVRTRAKEIAEKKENDFVIIDGPPGIGCPVIACIGGVDIALVVTEPTMSGFHDAQRVIDVTRHFNVPVKLIVNKYDLNTDMTKEIENNARKRGVEVIGKIAFDKSVVEAVSRGKTIIEYADGKTKKEIVGIWKKLQKIK